VIIGIASADYLRAEKSPTGTEQWGGAGWARVGQYVSYLREHHDVAVGTLWKADGVAQIQTEDKKFVKPDLIILQRIMIDGVPELLTMAKNAGQIIVNDIDDWYWGLDPRNQAFNAAHPKKSPKENVNHYRAVVSKSDLIITSTPYLQTRLMDMFNKTIPVVVSSNYVDTNRFSVVEQHEDFVKIGWAGSTGHRSGDLQTLRGVLSRVASDPYVKLHHSGAHPGAPAFSSEAGVEGFELTTSPLATYDTYPSLLNFDVGIVPLSDTPFNYAKSDIKGLEYAASGIPFVSSYSPSYESLMKDWGSGFFVAKKPNDWIKSLNKLKDYSLRCEYQSYIVEKVKSRHIDIGAAALLDTLEGMV
jgi:glycosyltransferase involved in cell wall biosynthesis